MERALKERIVGAIVLVVFVVLVVPVFLDGPPEQGNTVSERVLLPGQSEQETRTVVLDRERSVPIPASTGSQSPESAPPVVEQPVRPQPAGDNEADAGEAAPKPTATEPSAETAVERPRPRTTSTTGMWAVQLGSFSNKQNAEKLAAELRTQGYAAFLSQLQTGSGTLHRVRIGPQKDRDSAEAMAARLLKVNHKGQVVPHP